MRTAIYPGSFDPMTYGHLDIVKRALKLFDKIIIGVAAQSNKNTLFSVDERVDIIKNEIVDLDENGRIVVEKFDGLLVNFAVQKKCYIVIRGLRAVSDFEYEFQLFGTNEKLNSEVQTIFLPASEAHHFTASRLVREVARLDGDVSKFVSQKVVQRLRGKYGKK